MKQIFQFLSELAKNNNREWFHANKPNYEIAKNEFVAIIDNLIRQIQKFDSDLGDIEVKRAIFRINRDIRFSKDKSPYKLNFGAAIAKGGKKLGYSGYYLHLEPGASFIGAGFYKPQTDVLKKIRQEIYYNTELFLKIINNSNFIKEFGNVEGEKLKRPPKDFPADFEYNELLKFKSYVVMKKFSDEVVMSDSFVNGIVKSYKAVKDFNYFLNRAMGK